MKKLLCLLAALLLLCPAGLAEESKECEILLPDGYTGTLPVYRATLRNETAVPLFAGLDVSLFNQSGEPEFAPALLRKKPLRSGAYTYPDGAVLTTSPEALYYEEYDGTYYNVLLSAEDGSEIHSETPRSSLKSAIAGLAGGARQCWPDLDEQPQLTTDTLPGITLDEAKARMEALLEKLGVGDNARFVYGLDMQPERIRELGAHYNEVFSFQTPEWDFALATEEDQGFYVYYEFQLNGLDLQSMDSAPFSASAYFTREGMHSFRLTNPAVIGEIYDTPDALVSPETILTRFEKDNPDRIRYGFNDPTPVQMKLVYTLQRAPQKKDGMVLAPAWYVRYTFVDGVPKEGWVWYSALDGEKLLDCYQW